MSISLIPNTELEWTLTEKAFFLGMPAENLLAIVPLIPVAYQPSDRIILLPVVEPTTPEEPMRGVKSSNLFLSYCPRELSFDSFPRTIRGAPSEVECHTVWDENRLPQLLFFRTACYTGGSSPLKLRSCSYNSEILWPSLEPLHKNGESLLEEEALTPETTAGTPKEGEADVGQIPKKKEEQVIEKLRDELRITHLILANAELFSHGDKTASGHHDDNHATYKMQALRLKNLISELVDVGSIPGPHLLLPMILSTPRTSENAASLYRQFLSTSGAGSDWPCQTIVADQRLNNLLFRYLNSASLPIESSDTTSDWAQEMLSLPDDQQTMMPSWATSIPLRDVSCCESGALIISDAEVSEDESDDDSPPSLSTHSMCRPLFGQLQLSDDEKTRNALALAPWPPGISWGKKECGWLVHSDVDDEITSSIPVRDGNNTVVSALEEAVQMRAEAICKSADTDAAACAPFPGLTWDPTNVAWAAKAPGGEAKLFFASPLGVRASWVRATYYLSKHRRSCWSGEEININKRRRTASTGMEHLGAAEQPPVMSDCSSQRIGNAIQKQVASLMPFPPGIIWAKTTSRWFAIYRDEHNSLKKKFKTFGPKRYGGDCRLAFEAAVEFLKKVEPWQSTTKQHN